MTEAPEEQEVVDHTALSDLARGRAVSWHRITDELRYLCADDEDIQAAYVYMVEDDRISMHGFDGNGAVTWKAAVAPDEVSADIQVFLARRRLQKPPLLPEDDDES